MDFLSAPVSWTSLGLDPVALSIGPFALRWYSLAYIVGILVAWWLLLKMVEKPGSPATKKEVDDLITWGTLGVILGGRLAYVVFYDPAQYLAAPLSVFKLWEGGMSFHGGLVGVILAALIYARRHQLSALRILDHIAVVTPLGLMLGRLANFVNGELWGRPTDGHWGIIFPNAGPLPRVPSQLIEAATEGLLLLLLLQALFWRTNLRMRPGFLGGLFLMLYGTTRFLVEFVREPDIQLGVLPIGLTMGQLLSLPMVLIGLWLLATSSGRMGASTGNSNGARR